MRTNPVRTIRHLIVMTLALAMAAPAIGQEKKRNLLVIGQSKGYQHDSISNCMATLYNIGRASGKWDTCFRTDCNNITKKPLKWGAKNLNAFDAIAFFTDGDLDMDESQKADLLSSATTARASSASIARPSRFCRGRSMARCSAAISTVTLGAFSTPR